jgi:hypothetical protein
MADIVSNVSDLGIIVAAFRLTLGQSNLVNEQVANLTASISTYYQTLVVQQHQLLAAGDHHVVV